MTAETTTAPAAAPIPDSLALLRLARRVGMAKAAQMQAGKNYDAIKAAAQITYGQIRRRGTPSQEIRLPDGTKAGLITIERGPIVTTVDEELLTTVIAGNEPDAFEDFAAPAALAHPEVLAFLAEHLPHLVGRRVKPDVRAQYERELSENAGMVVDHTTGERVQVANITHLDPTGSFSVRWERKGFELLTEAMDAGLIGPDGKAATDEDGPVAEAAESGEGQ